jgi:hypothetical protein
VQGPVLHQLLDLHLGEVANVLAIDLKKPIAIPDIAKSDSLMNVDHFPKQAFEKDGWFGIVSKSQAKWRWRKFQGARYLEREAKHFVFICCGRISNCSTGWIKDISCPGQGECLTVW